MNVTTLPPVLRYLALALLAVLFAALIAREAMASGIDYRAGGVVSAKPADDIWRDGKRERDIPVRIYATESGPTRRPVIIFSHGLGGSREGGATWAAHWASYGFIVLALQHPGSDESIWKQRALRDREAALKSAMTAGNLALRVGDVRFAIDDIERRAAAGEGVWAQADLNRIGMSGHSFGASTTLALSGHRAPALAGQSGLDPRIVAAIGLSPMARQKSQLSRQFGDIRIPFFSVTGTEDNAVLGDTAVWQDRTLAFENMPAGGKYLLVIDGADHMVLGGRAMGRRKSNDHDKTVAATLKAATLAFWMAHLNGDKAAREWLEAPGGFAKSLPEADRFKWK